MKPKDRIWDIKLENAFKKAHTEDEKDEIAASWRKERDSKLPKPHDKEVYSLD